MCKKIIKIFLIFFISNLQYISAQENRKDIIIERNTNAAKDWEKGRKYALIIGISKYALENIPQLKYAVNDAKAIVEFLKKESYIKYDEVIFITDNDATRENILRKISDISKKISPQDTFFIYYSGHGKEQYLIPYNGDKEYLKATGIRWQEDIFNEISKTEAKQKILIIDSCHSGALLEEQIIALGKGELDKVNIDDQLLTQIGQGLFVITSSRANEISWENDKIQHGYFTYYLIEGLKGSADKISGNSFGNGDGYITADELYNYVSYQTNDAVNRDLNKSQHPRKSFNGEGMIFLSKVMQDPKQKSYLNINSTPNGVVYINSNIEGTTPIIKKELLPGSYDIMIESKGYLVVKKTIQIDAGKEENISVELKKNVGYITINTIPWGMIYIDGKYIGITPMVEEKIESGEHEIEIQTENEKYFFLKQKIVILPGQNNIYSWQLKEK